MRYPPVRASASSRARTSAQWRELVAGWWPALVDARLRQITWPMIEAHRDYIVAQLESRGDAGDDPSAAAR